MAGVEYGESDFHVVFCLIFWRMRLIDGFIGRVVVRAAGRERWVL